MDNIYTDAHLQRLPWLTQPAVRARINETAKKMAAIEQKAAQLQSAINDLTAEPPILNAQLLKRRAALLKTLNLTDATIIAAQEKVLIDLEKAALDTQKTAAADKKIAVKDDLYTFLNNLLSALDVSPRPGQPAWIIPFAGQEPGAGIPIMTPKLVLDAGLKIGIERHRFAFTATQLRHKEKAAAKQAKRAAQKEKDDTVLAFTNASFNAAVTAAVRRQNGRRQPASRRPQSRQSQPRNPRANAAAQPAAQPRPRPRRNLSASRTHAPVGRAQPAPRPPLPARSGNGAGRRREAPRAGRPPPNRAPSRAGRSRSPYPLRRTAARAAPAAQRGGRRG
jgi:hypothetical protein